MYKNLCFVVVIRFIGVNSNKIISWVFPFVSSQHKIQLHCFPHNNHEKKSQILLFSHTKGIEKFIENIRMRRRYYGKIDYSVTEIQCIHKCNSQWPEIKRKRIITTTLIEDKWENGFSLWVHVHLDVIFQNSKYFE